MGSETGENAGKEALMEAVGIARERERAEREQVKAERDRERALKRADAAHKREIRRLREIEGKRHARRMKKLGDHLRISQEISKKRHRDPEMVTLGIRVPRVVRDRYRASDEPMKAIGLRRRIIEWIGE